jgi:hypothetical protein
MAPVEEEAESATPVPPMAPAAPLPPWSTDLPSSRRWATPPRASASARGLSSTMSAGVEPASGRAGPQKPYPPHRVSGSQLNLAR